jgi:hypothetical protein
MRKWMLTVLLVLIAGVFVFPAAAQEATEDEGTFTLQLLEPGVVYEGELDSIDDAQLFVFDATAGDVVTIRMEATDTEVVDTFLVLLGAAGEVYAYNDDDDTATESTFNSAIVDFEIPETGSYMVLAATYRYLTVSTEWMAEVSGVDVETIIAAYEGLDLSYTLVVEGNNPTEAAGSGFEYAAVAVEVPVEGGLPIIAGEPITYVTFVGEEGQVIDVTLASDDAMFDPLLMIFDTFGYRLDVNDNSTNGDTSAALEGVELPADGEYFIFATHNSFFDPEFNALFEEDLEVQFSLTEAE